MKKTSAFILCIVVLLASSFAAYARPHHRFHHHPAPVVHYSHPHHYHHGPSRGWYNGALIVGATLAGLELVSEIARPPQTTVVEKTVQVPVVSAQPQVVIQQPVVSAQPQVVYVQQPQPPVVVTPTPAPSAPRTVVEETWRVLPDGTRVKVSEKTIVQ